jgi:hypothetical protein
MGLEMPVYPIANFDRYVMVLSGSISHIAISNA